MKSTTREPFNRIRILQRTLVEALAGKKGEPEAKVLMGTLNPYELKSLR